ncbi:MAG TPA: hypothetical protein EYP57_05250 [Thermodesulfobacteriaceae bacterium]|nr:hypothetical protein [Thermodesulfobacteriaceae bacterium]
MAGTEIAKWLVNSSDRRILMPGGPGRPINPIADAARNSQFYRYYEASSRDWDMCKKGTYCFNGKFCFFDKKNSSQKKRGAFFSDICKIILQVLDFNIESRIGQCV